MKKIKEYIGFSFIVLGFIILLLLLITLPEYVSSFPDSAIYQYVVGNKDKYEFIKISGNEIEISNNFIRIIALFFGFMFLNIWMKVGTILINSGKKLITDDIENVKQIIRSLSSKK